MFEEVFFGILKVTRNKQLLEHYIFEILVVDFSKQDPLLAPEIEYDMEKVGKKKPMPDSQIASSVINHHGSLFRLNIKYYEEILKLNLIKI